MLSFHDDDADLFWSLRQAEEQYSLNFFNANVRKRVVDTNLWDGKSLKMKIYSANDDEIQLWLRNEELGERWYDIYQLKRLTDENVKKALENAEDDNEANPAAVYDEIRRLLNVEINAFGN